MATFYEAIEPSHQVFMSKQLMFFTATAADSGRINLSPKGMDSLRVLDSTTVAYLDLTGSANETAAHLRTRDRLTLMFCSFGPDPLILRLYGTATAVPLNSDRGRELRPEFEINGELLPGGRQFIELHVESTQESCGFAVPLYSEGEERGQLRKWALAKVRMGTLEEFHRDRNSFSIDGFSTGLTGENSV